MGIGDGALSAVGQVVDPTSLMQRVADQTLSLIRRAGGVAIGLLSGNGITYVSGAGAGRAAIGTRVEIDDSLSGVAIRTGLLQQSTNTQIDPRADAAACLAFEAVSLVCVPLVRSGEVFGVMAVNAPRPHAFSDEDVAVLTQLADFVGAAIGSAWDLHRISNQLVQLSTRRGEADGGEQEQHPAEAHSRYVMTVLSPHAVGELDARRRIERVLAQPELLQPRFQPIVDVRSGEVLAVEALSRFFVSPGRPPNEWFDEAARVGLGVELELLALRQALASLPLLPDHVPMTLNVGPATMLSDDLLQTIGDRNAGRLVLELTEHLSFDDYPALRTKLTSLRRAGLRLAVDDAGSGYSSLTHILKMAPDFIKLDRELVSGIDLDAVRRALVVSLVTFAEETGAKIIAEGVETADELEIVRQLGVRYVQGYYFGRPAPMGELLTAPDVSHRAHEPRPARSEASLPFQ